MKKRRRLPGDARPLRPDALTSDARLLEFIQATDGSMEHRELIQRSALCGCKQCRHLFPPDEIREWTDERDGIGRTAFCPKCGLDAVIGSASPHRDEMEVLRELCHRWGVRLPSHGGS